MIATKYSNLTDEEFLNAIDGRKGASPIIDELIRRWQLRPHVSSNGDRRAECPVCEASLVVAYDEGNQLFQLELQGDN